MIQFPRAVLVRTLLSAFLCTFLLWPSPPLGASPPEPLRFLAAPSDGVLDEYLVVLSQDGASASPASSLQTGGAVAAVARELSRQYGGTVLREWHRGLPAFLLRIDSEAARTLSRDPRVRLVEQNRVLALQLAQEELPSEGLTAFPAASNEAGLEATIGSLTQPINGCPTPGPSAPPVGCISNWGLDRIDATSTSTDRDNLYSYNATGAGVHVYLFDSGGTPSHPQFGGRILDHNTSGPLTDTVPNSHGTRVASIIGGSISGVAKQVYFHIAVLPGGGNGATTTTYLDAFDWIIDHKQRNTIGPAVVNTSFNVPKFSDDPLYPTNTISTAISIAAEKLVLEHDLTLVVSAGNRETQPEDFSPSDLGHLEGVIVVGGTNENDQRWTRLGDAYSEDDFICTNPEFQDCGSNHSPGVDIWAPAAWIYGATRDGGASTLSGTSFAAPHVTGAVALYLQQNPTATPAQVEAALKANAQSDQLSDIGAAPNLLLNTSFIPDLSALSIPPVARYDHISTVVDTAISVEPLLNDFDRNGSSLTLLSVSSPSANGGTVTRVGPVVTYTPANDFTGSDTFTYSVQDSQSLTAQATVGVTVRPDLPPTALPDHVLMPYDSVGQWSEGSFFFNDIDPEGTILAYVSHTTTADGTLERVEDGIFFAYRFTPDPSLGPEHTYSFTYRVRDSYAGNDGTVHEDTGEVFITTYDPVGTNLPQIQDDEFYSWGDPIQFNVLDNDTDNGTLSLLSVHGEKTVSVYLQPDGTVAFSNSNPLGGGLASRTSTLEVESRNTTPEPPVEGLYGGFTYIAEDNDGNLGVGRATVRINSNQAPIAQDDGIAVPAGSAYDIDIASELLGNDFDPDLDPLHLVSWIGVQKIHSGGSAGTLVKIGDSLRYTPEPGFQGEAFFRYWVYDNWGHGDLATVYLVVGDLKLLYDDFETGDLSRWDASTGTIAATTASAKEDVYGLRAKATTSQNPAFVTDLGPDGSRYMQAGFWFQGDLALPLLPVDTPQPIYVLRQDSPQVDAVRLEVRSHEGCCKQNVLQLRAVLEQDSGPDFTTPWTEIDAWTWIELEWSSEGISSGSSLSMILSANGVEIGTATNLDISQQSIDRALLGMIAPSGMTTVTMVYFDDYRTRR